MQLDPTALTEITATAAVIVAFLFMLTRGAKMFRRLETMQLVMTVTLLDLQRTLLGHDLTVRGLNPEAGGTPEERDSRALGLYREILGHLERRENRLNGLLEKLAD